jgi:Flp pilus assembly protein TadD
LGLACNSLGDAEGAIAALQASVKVNPDQPDAQNQLGLLLQRAGGLEEAAVAFRQFIRLEPSNPDAQNNLGLSLAEWRW